MRSKQLGSDLSTKRLEKHFQAMFPVIVPTLHKNTHATRYYPLEILGDYW
jgi:hypothetical protein